MKYGFFLLSLWVVFACSPQHAGTNTAETQNAITVRLLDSLGAPVLSAQVWIVGLMDWDEDVRDGSVDSMRILNLDAQGRINLDLDSNQSYGVWVEDANGKGIFKILDHDSKDSVWVLRSKNSQSILLRHEDSVFVPINALRLRGTPLLTTVDPLGNVVFDNLVPGDYEPVVEGTWQPLGTVSLNVSDSSASRVDSLLVTSGSMAVEDFDDGDAYSNLHDWTGGGKWWIFSSDSLLTITPKGFSSWTDGLRNESEGAHHGLSMCVTVQEDNDAQDSVVLLGVNLGLGTAGAGTQFAWADLTEMTSLHFWAKGDGPVYVFLKTLAIDTLGDNEHLNVKVNLTSQWQEFTIPLGDFKPFPNSMAERQGILPADAVKRVLSIFFQIGHSGEFWLDDMTIEGMEVLQFHSL